MDVVENNNGSAALRTDTGGIVAGNFYPISDIISNYLYEQWLKWKRNMTSKSGAHVPSISSSRTSSKACCILSSEVFSETRCSCKKRFKEIV
jgi:hypothetical protein